jgi:hypothetical protein
MIYEMRTYQIHIGRLAEYLALFERDGLPIITRYARLVGFWTTETGALGSVVHIWCYDDCGHRQRQRAALYSDPEWVDGFIPRAMPLIAAMHSTLLDPAAFSPLR